MANDRGSLLQRWQLLVHALCDDTLSKGDCTVLAVIAGHAGKGGVAWPGVNRIASIGGIHRTTVIASVDKLVSKGLLEVAKKKGCANRYRLASASSVDATGTSRVDATSQAGGPVGSEHSTSSVDATGVVAPALPDQSRGRYPNSAFELDLPNSRKATQLPAALSFDQGVEQEPKPSAEDLKAQREEAAKKRIASLQAEYLETRSSRPEHARMMERLFAKELADVMQPADCNPVGPSGLRKLVP